MQIVAMLTMLIDHIGKMFFEDQWIWRAIGRLAFPIYAYCIVQGYKNTRNIKAYMIRLLVIAILSQIPFMLALNIVGINVVATLLVCIMVLYLMEKLDIFLWISITIILAAIMDAFHFDYGLYGLLLVFIYRYVHRAYWVYLHLGLNLLFLLRGYWLIEMVSTVSTILIVYFPQMYNVLDRYKVPKWVWRSFYPVHLTGIAIFRLLLL
jgi:hypothetical protein